MVLFASGRAIHRRLALGVVLLVVDLLIEIPAAFLTACALVGLLVADQRMMRASFADDRRHVVL